MKIKPFTEKILKYYAGINPGIVIKESNEDDEKTFLKTVSSKSNNPNFFAKVEVPNTFDKPVAIHDLNKLLSVLSTFSDKPEVKLKDDHMVISTDSSSVQYRYSKAEFIKNDASDKDVELPNVQLGISLEKQDVIELQKFANIMNLTHVAILNEGNKIVLEGYDESDPSSNKYRKVVEEDSDLEEGTEFKYILSSENLKLIPHDYDVEFFMGNNSGIAHFSTVFEEEDEKFKGDFFFALDHTSYFTEG